MTTELRANGNYSAVCSHCGGRFGVLIRDGEINESECPHCGGIIMCLESDEGGDVTAEIIAEGD